MTPPHARADPAGGRPGVFIVIEGPEGAGKSTQLTLLADRLGALGRRCVVTREPGGTRAGDAIRRVLLDPAQTIGPLAEFLLYSASRAQLIEEVIRPALSAGLDVISDRFTGASVAYQGHGRGLDLSLIDDLNARVTGGLSPDLTVLLDIEPRTGLKRAAARSGHDRLEAESLEFHARVRAGFVSHAQGRPDWLLIDGSADQDAIAASVWRAVEAVLGERGGGAAQ